jgi:hypothetical protein
MKHCKEFIWIVSALALVSCASGSAIVTGDIRPAINSSEVRLYLDPPAEYETIGIVEAASDVEFSSQAAQDRAIEELKEQAARIGANGVLITNTANESGDVVGSFVDGVFYGGASETRTARGRAIFVVGE